MFLPRLFVQDNPSLEAETIAGSAAHGKSAEAPVLLLEDTETRVSVTAVVAGERLLLPSIVYMDSELLGVKLSFSATPSMSAHVS